MPQLQREQEVQKIGRSQNRRNIQQGVLRPCDAQEQKIISKKRAVPDENATVPEENATVPEENTTVPKEKATVPKEKATAPEENATVPKENATASEHLEGATEEDDLNYYDVSDSEDLEICF